MAQAFWWFLVKEIFSLTVPIDWITTHLGISLIPWRSQTHTFIVVPCEGCSL